MKDLVVSRDGGIRGPAWQLITLSVGDKDKFGDVITKYTPDWARIGYRKLADNVEMFDVRDAGHEYEGKVRIGGRTYSAFTSGGENPDGGDGMIIVRKEGLRTRRDPSREVKEMRDMLSNAGYESPDSWARTLRAEGMGPTELAHRIRQRSLGRTHGILLKRRSERDVGRVKGAKRREFLRLFRSTGHQFQAQGELTPSERRRAASQALRAHNYQACRKAGHKHCEHILYPGGKVPEARPWEMDPARTRRYHIVAINERTGKKSYQTSSPLTHQEAVVMLRKFSYHPKRRVQLEEVVGDAKRDPGGEFEVWYLVRGKPSKYKRLTQAQAEKEMRRLKRMGFTAWIQDARGNHVPVRGAMRKP